MSLHVYTDEEEHVIAETEADARTVMAEHVGEESWTDDIEVRQEPDDKALTIWDETAEGRVKETKTCAEWAKEKGRGYLCGPDW